MKLYIQPLCPQVLHPFYGSPDSETCLSKSVQNPIKSAAINYEWRVTTSLVGVKETTSYPFVFGPFPGVTTVPNGGGCEGPVGSKATWLQLCKDLITLRYLVVHSGWKLTDGKSGGFFFGEGKGSPFSSYLFWGAWVVDVVEK